MKNISFKVSEEVHFKIKLEALKRNKTIKQFVIELIDRELKEQEEI